MKISNVGEIKLIKAIREELKNQPNLFNPIGDDSAVFKLADSSLKLFTTDSQVKDIHFKLDTAEPIGLGFKSISINVSDVAAMAGKPRFALISLGLEKDMDFNFVMDLFKGFKLAAKKYDLSIAGGDITTTNTFFINISLIGEVEPELLRKRSSAKPTQDIYVSGKLGASSAGLALMQNKLESRHKDYLITKHTKPIARVQESRLASKLGAQAMEDISDGLLAEINHICEESNCGAALYAQQIPIDTGVEDIANQINLNPLQFALSGGEDYEIVFTTDKDNSKNIEEAFNKENLELYKIGEVTSNNKISVLDKDNNELSFDKGWEHLN